MTHDVPTTLKRRGFVQLLVAAGTGTGAFQNAAAAVPDEEPAVDDHVTATYKAAVDGIIPPTPVLARRLEDHEYTANHGPGALAIDLHEALIHMLNGTYETPTPTVRPAVDAHLAEPIAGILDGAASELLARGGNEDEPRPDRFPGGGTFASLSRPDRLRALSMLDDNRDERVVSQVVCAYTALLYYSEWDGYEEFDSPPSEREFTGDVQGWEQSGYPGSANGYAALRGYEVERFREDRP